MRREEAPSRRELRALQLRFRYALEGFLQAVLDNDSALRLEAEERPEEIARRLWQEGLSQAFRLLYIARIERAAGLRISPPWPAERSPDAALPGQVPPPERAPSPPLERRIREAVRRFREGDPELGIPPHPGALFAPATTARLDAAAWGELASSRLLVGLLAREEAPGALTPIPWEGFPPEVLGWIFEALVELEPGLSTGPLVRLRRGQLEAVLPADEAESPGRRPPGGQVREVERLGRGRFYVRTGLGRKATGAFYTPSPLARFLVKEVLGPLTAAALASDDPRPDRLLALRVLDPAMGAGHFLVEACRHLGQALLEACRRCLALAERTRSAALRGRVDSLTSPPGRLTGLIGRDLRRAGALCRRLVMARCLYGVDLDARAVELAQLALWLEASVDDGRLPCLDQHLIVGDALTGCSLEHLGQLPQSRSPLAPRVSEELSRRLARSLEDARALAARRDEANAALDGSAEEQAALAVELDRALAPLRELAAAWSGGVMLGEELAGADEAYQAAVSALLEESAPPPQGSLGAALRAMLETGRQGVPLELAFPELSARGEVPGGADAVLGNPPWDKLLPLEREFFAGLDLTVLTVPTARERRPVYEELRRTPSIRSAWEAYSAPFAHTRRFVSSTYHAQTAAVDGAGGPRKTSGHADSYRAFAERSWDWLSPAGRLGLVLPNSFYGAQGATGLRRLLLHRSALELCLGFTNAEGIFEIGQGQRFCLVVAEKGRKTETFRARFGLTDPSALEDGSWRQGLLSFDLSFLERLAPEYLGFPELSGPGELELVSRLHAERNGSFGALLRAVGIRLYQEMNMTSDSSRFSRTDEVLGALGLPHDADPRREPLRTRLRSDGWLVVHEKGTFHSYDDLLKTRPRYLCHEEGLGESGGSRGARALAAASCYRLVARSTIHASEAEKSVFSLIPPGAVVGNSALTEAAPQDRPDELALLLLALCNSRPFNFVARLKLGTNLNQFILGALPVPPIDDEAETFLAHQALRLTCNHDGYRRLWQEQLGELWREEREALTFPALCEADRALVRSRVDALVAWCYGLDRELYGRSLGGFSPAGRSAAEHLEVFDELCSTGLSAFVARHDPYHDRPLRASRRPPAFEKNARTSEPGGAALIS